MFVRYHLIYYAIFSLLLVISEYVHPIFALVLAIYVIFMILRVGWKSLIICVILAVPLLRTISTPSIPRELHGYVVAKGTNNIVIKTDVGKIKVYTEKSFRYLDEITFTSEALEIRPSQNDNGFDESHYLKGAHIVGKVTMKKLLRSQHHFSFANVIEDHLSQNKTMRSYQRLFLLGMKDEEIKEDYASMTSLSIVHMFALSGMHIAILYSLLSQAFGLILPKNQAKWAAKIAIGFYVWSIPYNISLHRAFGVLILNDVLKKKFNSLDTLSMLVIGHLIYNPYVFYSTSFVFSYFVYLMVILTARYKYNTVLIYMSSLPLVMSMNYQVNILSFLLADLLMPFVEGFYVLTLGATVFSILKLPLSLMLYIFGNLLRMTQALSRFLSFQKPTLLFIGLYYYAFLMILYHLDDAHSIKKYILFLTSLLIAFHIYSIYKPYSEVGMVNVGQGDCSYIRLPWHEGNFLIDTGGNRHYDVATYNVIPFLRSKGIDHLDTVYISHGDFDHCGALDSLKLHYPVKKVIKTYQKPKTIGPMTIRFLKRTKTFGNENDDCQVQYVTLHGLHYLFTGDISAEAESNLVDHYKTLDVDVLKVAHHGSRYSSSVKFFEMVSPKIAFIGVGKNNFYGHPGDIVIKRLNERGVYILRTDQDGNFCIRDYVFMSGHYVFKHSH